MNQEAIAGTPADPTVRYTPLALDGAKYHLCFDFHAIAKAEEMTGMELLFGVDFSKISALRLRAMLLACLLKAHPEMTLDQVTKYIVHRNIFTIQDAVSRAWVNSTPDHEEQNAAAPDHEEQNAAAPNPPQPEPSPANA